MGWRSDWTTTRAMCGKLSSWHLSLAWTLSRSLLDTLNKSQTSRSIYHSTQLLWSIRHQIQENPRAPLQVHTLAPFPASRIPPAPNRTLILRRSTRRSWASLNLSSHSIVDLCRWKSRSCYGSRKCSLSSEISTSRIHGLLSYISSIVWHGSTAKKMRLVDRRFKASWHTTKSTNVMKLRYLDSSKRAPRSSQATTATRPSGTSHSILQTLLTPSIPRTSSSSSPIS